MAYDFQKYSSQKLRKAIILHRWMDLLHTGAPEKIEICYTTIKRDVSSYQLMSELQIADMKRETGVIPG